MINLRLIRQFTYRSWRYGELSIILITLSLCALLITSISLLQHRVRHAIDQQAYTLLGGQLTLWTYGTALI